MSSCAPPLLLHPSLHLVFSFLELSHCRMGVVVVEVFVDVLGPLVPPDIWRG